MIHVFLMAFLTNKVYRLKLLYLRVDFFGCSYEGDAKYFVNKNLLALIVG